MSRCLFVSQRIGRGYSGATVGSERNLHHCRELFGPGGLDVYKIEKGRVPAAVRRLLQAFGFVDDLLPRDVKEVLRKTRDGSYDVVFLDSSYFGVVASALARRRSTVKIVVFYHDILVEWWRSAAEGSRWRRLFWARVYRRVEGLSTRAATVRIFFTERDRERLRMEYGAAGGPIVPVSVADRFRADRCRDVRRGKPAGERVLLFVGVDYKPNVDGVAWFIERVMPRIGSRLRIVGRGMERYRDEWESERVSVAGTVEDLDREYMVSDAVVIPLFAGTGMKIKTAEALMFGKRIFGTPEAFRGFRIDFDAVGALCESDDEFVTALAIWEKAELDSLAVNEASRAAYEKAYSYSATVSAMGRALGMR